MGFLNGHLKMPPNWGRNAQKKHEHSCTRNFTGKSRPERRKNALDRVEDGRRTRHFLARKFDNKAAL